MDKSDIFPMGSSIKFIGETGNRWIQNDYYIYLGNGSVTDRYGYTDAPTLPNYLIDNFISLEKERDDKIVILLN